VGERSAFGGEGRNDSPKKLEETCLEVAGLIKW
jgi:hypothetical protein